MERTIGVLTSGGDAPGMNAAIRAVVRAGIKKGFRMVGIRRGYNGLINGDIFEMDMRSVSDILQRGGTVLYTARCDEFRYEEGLQKAKKPAKRTALRGLSSLAETVRSAVRRIFRRAALNALACRELLIMISSAQSIPSVMIPP